MLELRLFSGNKIGECPKRFALKGGCDREREPAGQPDQQQRSGDPADAILDPVLLKQATAVLAVVILGFIFARPLGVAPATIAMAGAAVLMFLDNWQHHNEKQSANVHKTFSDVEWITIFFFIGLFVVNQALQKTGLPARLVSYLAESGIPLQHLGPLFATTFVLSNIVSNVPAVMLLLPTVAHTLAGPTLALVSTLAGNLLIVGSVANIIVVDTAARRGIAISWRQHARIGIPVTLVTLAILAFYLALRSAATR